MTCHCLPVLPHTTRGHTDFAESTEEIAPLTEAEKQARLEELRQRLKEKRANQAIADREDQKKNEVSRATLQAPRVLTRQPANLSANAYRKSA